MLNLIIILLCILCWYLYYYKTKYQINKIYIDQTRDFLSKNPHVDHTHGLSHFLIVLDHACKALSFYPNPQILTDRNILCVKLASFLHDVDDHKYFPMNQNYENARQILKICQHVDNLTMDEIEIIIKMISLVSASKNGDVISPDLPDWYYYPRYADRCDAVGNIAVKKTFDYTKMVSRPMYTSNTLLFTTNDNLFQYILTNKQRYEEYQMGKISESMIDHFYDKLLHFSLPIKNTYFDKIMTNGMLPMFKFVVYFGNIMSITNKFTEKDVESFLQN